MRTSSARTAAAAALVLQIASSDARKLALLRKKNGNGSRGPAFLAPLDRGSGNPVVVVPGKLQLVGQNLAFNGLFQRLQNL